MSTAKNKLAIKVAIVSLCFFFFTSSALYIFFYISPFVIFSCPTDVNLPPPATPPTHLSQAPQEVQKILEGEHMWNFNILQLERLTNHRLALQSILIISISLIRRFGGREEKSSLRGVIIYFF